MNCLLRHSAIVAVFSWFASVGLAEVEIPSKEQWKLHDGSTIHGRAYSFGHQLCFLQRRNGKLLLNGQKVDDPTSSDLLRRLCQDQSIPLDDPKRLQAILAKKPFAQIVLPYYTLKYHDRTGRDQQIPAIMLAADEIQLLRPCFEEWLTEKQREHEEQLRRAQELENQQAMLAMQAQALQAQQAMAVAATRSADASERNAYANEKNAEANRKQAEELERIRRGVR